MKTYGQILAFILLVLSCFVPSAEAGKAYVIMDTFGCSGYLGVIDADTHTITKVIDVENSGSVCQHDIAVSPSGDRAYIVGYLWGSRRSVVSVLDTATDNRLYSIGPFAYNVRFTSISVHPSGNFAYVQGRDPYDQNYVFVLDLNTNQVIKQISIGDGWGTGRVRISPSGDVAYATWWDSGSQGLVAIDTTTHEVIKTVWNASRVYDIAFSPSGDVAYAAAAFPRRLLRIDTTTHDVVGSLDIPGPYLGFFSVLRGVAVSPSGALVYAVSGDSVYAAVDAASFSVIKWVYLGSAPYSSYGFGAPHRVAFSPEGDFAYMTSHSLSRMLVVNTATHEPITTIENLWNGGSMVFVPGNGFPIAEAGPDQTVECTDSSATPVTLDGSGSSDPDGDTLTYAWTPFDPPATGATPSVLLPYGTSTVTLTVDDGISGTSTDTADVTVADTTPPATTAIINGTMGDDGWYVSDVTITLNATDGCTGVKEVHYRIDSQGQQGVEQVVQGASAAFTIDTDGQHILTFWAEDMAGNDETEQGPVSFKIDRTPPAITIADVTEGAKYPACIPPTPSYSVTDGTSGTGTSSAELTGGNANGVGAHTYAVTATDAAGNTVTEVVTYKLVYTFAGFETPVTLDKPFKTGSTIPVKFMLTDGCGAYVDNATATLSLQQISGAEPSGDPIDGTTNVPDSGNVFRYDLTDNHYIYNLSTDGFGVGSWDATVTLDDGETYTINIGTK